MLGMNWTTDYTTLYVCIESVLAIAIGWIAGRTTSGNLGKVLLSIVAGLYAIGIAAYLVQTRGREIQDAIISALLNAALPTGILFVSHWYGRRNQSRAS